MIVMFQYSDGTAGQWWWVKPTLKVGDLVKIENVIGDEQRRRDLQMLRDRLDEDAA